MVLTNTILPRALGVENAAASDSLRGTLRGWRFGAWVAACAAWAYAFVALLQRFDMGLREGAEYAALLALLLWILDTKSLIHRRDEKEHHGRNESGQPMDLVGSRRFFTGD